MAGGGGVRKTVSGVSNDDLAILASMDADAALHTGGWVVGGGGARRPAAACKLGRLAWLTGCAAPHRSCCPGCRRGARGGWAPLPGGAAAGL
jgi:hypothetical protein